MTRPSLAGVAEVVVEVLSPVQDCLTSLQSCSQSVQVAIEGLLSHFFYPYLVNYHQEDVLWFMDLANRQAQWRPHPFQSEMVDEENMSPQNVEMTAGVVAGELADDLLSKLESSVLLDASAHTETEVEACGTTLSWC